MKKIIFASLFAMVSLAAVESRADGKAYLFTFDQAISETACLEKAIDVSSQYKLVIQPKEANGDHGLNDADGDRAGIAYYSQATCHIYVW